MKQIKGFKDGIYFQQWVDQQYNTRYWVLICPNKLNEMETFFRKLTKEDFKVSEKACAMCLERFDPTGLQNIFFVYLHDNSIQTIVHEVVHAKNYVFDHHGLRADPDNDEAEAYFVDYLVKYVMYTFKEREAKLNKIKENGRQRRKGNTPRKKNR